MLSSMLTMGGSLFHVGLIINGDARAARGDAVFERRQPVSGRVVTVSSAATTADAIDAANAAAAAFPGWALTPDPERARILVAISDGILRRVDDFIAAIATETGGAESWVRFNCQLAADIFRTAAGLTGFRRDKPCDGGLGNVRSTLHRQPVGVVLGIAPWNAPVILAARAVAMPLACGNTVVLKSSEFCPKTHSLLVEVMNECGLPPGVANLVSNAPEDSARVVEALVGHAAVRRVNFTGSTRVGRMVAETCARHLKQAVLELSGKAPLIVLDDADIDAAVSAAAYGAFFNQGQLCISTERIVVDDRVADDFVARLADKARSLRAGDPRSGSYALGSMISTEAAVRVQGLVEEATERGASLVAGGQIDKTIMQPTVLDHVNSSMRLYREESFGPVAAVIRVADEDEAISVANDTEFGLAAAVFSRDVDRARRVALRLETGICQINGPTVIDDPNLPFGGVKNSGYGKLGGAESIREFTELRWIATHESQMEYPI